MNTILKEIIAVVASLVWRGFGLFLFIAGTSAGVGAITTGSWVNGIVIAWATLMLGVVGAVGYAIAIRGKVSPADVASAVQDAAQKASDSAK